MMNKWIEVEVGWQEVKEVLRVGTQDAKLVALNYDVEAEIVALKISGEKYGEGIGHFLLALKEAIKSKKANNNLAAVLADLLGAYANKSGKDYSVLATNFMAYNPNNMVRLLAAQVARESFILERLIFDESNSVLDMALNNPNLPAQILWSILKQRDTRLRTHAASSQNCSLEMLRYASSDKESCVRRNVIFNGKVNQDILVILAKDKSIDVASFALQHPLLIHKDKLSLARSGPTLTKQILAMGNDREMHVILARDEDREVRRTLLKDRFKVPDIDILKLLSLDIEEDIRFQANRLLATYYVS